VNRLTKALFVPLTRALQILLIFAIILGIGEFLYYTVKFESYFWKINWKFALIAHIVPAYIVTIIWAYITKANYFMDGK